MQFHCLTLTEQCVILVYTGHIHQLQYDIVEFHCLMLNLVWLAHTSFLLAFV